MRKSITTGVALAAIAGTALVIWAPWASSASSGGSSACGTTYAPVLDPANFVSVIDNPYFPLPVGRTLVYTGIKDGQSQTDTVTVTAQKKVILGITTTVVHDVATHGSTVLEDTLDFYAQDAQGNVWYLGEDTTEFAQGGGASREGSWEAGRDGAQAGVIVAAHPRPGLRYRQEYYAGHAEDRAEVASLHGRARVPFGRFENLLVTRDSNPLSRGPAEHKYYAKGVGPVLGVSGGGSREALVSFHKG